MQKPKPTTDYEHGQMMGMLVIVTMFENAREAKISISGDVIQTIKEITARDLAEYLDKPEEDVLLLVDEQLRRL